MKYLLVTLNFIFIIVMINTSFAKQPRSVSNIAGFHENFHHEAEPVTHSQNNFFHHHDHQDNNTVIFGTVPTYYGYTYPIVSAPVNSEDSDYPAPTQSIPNGDWVTESGTEVPENAVIYQMNNDTPSYYCRVKYDDNIYYGMLIPNKGCYINNNFSSTPFNDYEVLISQY